MIFDRSQINKLNEQPQLVCLMSELTWLEHTDDNDCKTPLFLPCENIAAFN